MNTKERAKQYFDALGINPYVKGPLYKEGLLDKPPIPKTKTLEQEVCIVSISCIIFFTYVEVIIPEKNWFFQGYTGGIGWPGFDDGPGDIYYDNLDTLTRAHTFGVAFGAEGAGVAQVTWGTSGNATAAVGGESTGVFVGSGNWGHHI